MMDRFVLSQGARNRTELGVVGVLTGRSARRRGPDSQSARRWLQAMTSPYLCTAEARQQMYQPLAQKAGK